MPSDAPNDISQDAPRGIPAAEIPADSELLPTAGEWDAQAAGDPALRYRVLPEGEPQAPGTKYSVVDLDTGVTSYAGKILKYGARLGLSRASDLLLYDRFKAAEVMGAWAHFIWPSVVAESNGRHISINAWDRAHFTWGFYQLAAHTPRDNLILLMRELVALPSARRYFPDLVLHNGTLAKQTDAGPVSLEKEYAVQVGDETEMQIVDFMTYLNPSSYRLDEREVIVSAKFAAWAGEDSAMREATVRVSLEIMKRKIKARATTFGLFGRRPELAIWVSDMYHQGRASKSQVRAALALPTFDQQIDGLSKIDATGKQSARLNSVKRSVQTLMDEKRFVCSRFGEGELSF